MESSHFAQLLKMMMGVENELRNAAEKEYENIPLKVRGQCLFSHYSDATNDVESRSFALVLLRRLISNSYEEFIKEMPADQFHAEFLRFMTAETQSVLRKRLTDLLAELARNTIDEQTGKQKWTGIMQFLEMCATSEDANFREAGMSLIENVPNIFGSDSPKYMAGIKQMFQSSLLYGANSSVRTAAVRAYVAFVCDNEESDSIIRQLSDLIPAVIKVCQHVVETEDDDDVPLQCLGDLAVSTPKLLIPHFNDIFTLCSSTVANPEKDDSYRHSSLEVMISMCESGNYMRKKGAAYLPALIQQCLQLMTELDDELEEWMQMDDADDDLEEETAGIGETSLDRIACALGGKVVMTHVLQCTNELLANENWKCRYAGLCALSTIGEGCKKQMEPLIHDIANQMVLPKIADPHPRVRYAVCNAIGQMCTDFAPTIQKKCHEKIVPVLLSQMTDLTNPRVAAHAAAAMVNFCEDCPKSIISIYLPALMEKLESVLSQTFQQLLQSGKKLVLEQIITTIASVADAAQDHFIAYYNKLVPPLKYIFENAKEDNLKMMRGKTIECISLIGMAVGAEQFGKDADEIMQFLLSSGVNFENNDDPQISYFISAWARICKILGKGFAKYLDLIMPCVLAAADFKPDVQILDGGTQEDEEEWDYLPLDDNRQLGIKTAGLEDKLTACEMIVCFSRELKDDFVGYVERVLNMFLPLLKFVFHDGVRSAAAECLPCLMVSAKAYGEEYLKRMWGVILGALKEAIERETDIEVVAEMLNAISEVVENFGETAIVSEQDIETICTIIHDQLQRFEKRKMEREKGRDKEDEDDEDNEQLNEVLELETTVLARISDINHYLFMTRREAFLPYFDRLVGQYSALLDSRRSYQERQWGICIFDDLIEYGGQASLNYQNIFLQPLVNAISDKYPEVRQAAAYGAGILGAKGGLAFAKICAQLIQPLIGAIDRPDARNTEENITAMENAVSAISKILKYNSSEIQAKEQLIARFIGFLPVWNDQEEVPYVYDYFCDLVETQAVQDPSRVFQIILYSFSHGAFDADESPEMRTVKERLKTIMKHFLANQELLNQIIQSLHLNGHQKSVLEQIMN